MNIGHENETTEFKESTAELHQAIESISSILNKHGYGIVYFGVKDNGDICGQIVSDSTLKTIYDAVLRDIEPRIIPTIESLEYEGNTIIKVSFSGNQKPYSAFGKFLTRVGTQNRHLTRDELKKLIKDEDYSFPWEKEESSITIEEISDEALHQYYEEAISCGRLDMPLYNKETLLSMLELYKNNRLCNAAEALFGKNANISLKLASYATNEKLTFTDLNEIKGNIYTLSKKAISYILNNIRWNIIIEDKREEIPEIPVRAIREIVINAFAHAIYQPTPTIEIDIHPNMITIYNPGSFPNELTPDDYIQNNISSIKRNPLILDVLYRCKDVEKSGTGFKRVNELCLSSNIRWSYKNTAYGFYFTFYRKQNNYKYTDSHNDLTQIEIDVLDLIKQDSRIARKAIAFKTGKSVRTIQRITNDLSEKGYISRIGNNRFGHWEVL